MLSHLLQTQRADAAAAAAAASSSGEGRSASALTLDGSSSESAAAPPSPTLSSSSGHGHHHHHNHHHHPHSYATLPAPLSPSRTVPVPMLTRLSSFDLAGSAAGAGGSGAGSAPPSMLPTRVGGDRYEWMEVDVSSPEAFQRVSLGVDILSAEQRVASQLLVRALQLREKHFTCRKPDYYWGSCETSDYPYAPVSRPPPERNAVGSPIALAGGARGGWGFGSSGSGGGGASSGAPGGSVVAGGGDGGGGGETPSFDIPTPRGSPRAGEGGRGGAQASQQPTPTPPPMPGSPALQKLFYRRRPEPVFRPFTCRMIPRVTDLRVVMVDGIARVTPATTTAATATASADAPTASDAAQARSSLYPVPEWSEWQEDYAELCRIIHTPAVKTFAFRRLELLGARFALHTQLNTERESQEQKAVPHRDVYNVRKCDTHVHHSACMNQKHLLRFIKSKLRKESDTVVINRDGQDLTLGQVFESLHLTAYDLSIDTLDMHADFSTTFHRFDRFNLKYNPVGASRLREIFLKTDNMLAGRFLAELTREVFDDLSASKYQIAEYRLSIYGKSQAEWRKLAAWVVNNRLACPQVRWMVQIPRLYETLFAGGSIKNFQQMLDNIFLPLFAVTLDPSVDPDLHQFLGLVVGIDTVDDESKTEPPGSEASLPLPAAYASPTQPPYSYWSFFIAQNIAVLNALRASRGLTQFSFRPHCGEAGAVEHLAAGLLTAEGINHGINLRRSPSLQYLYYLAQVGIAMSPLSNNRLFLTLPKNPFHDFFSRGLNVSLSTDDPLMLAFTKEPLLEEYAVAAQVWRLSSADMCEIARNSVLQSGWEYPWKAHFLGPNYQEPGPDGNDIHFTNVPYIRVQYRFETLRGELELIDGGARAQEEEEERMAAAAASSLALHRLPSGQQWMAPPALTIAAAAGNAAAMAAKAAVMAGASGPGARGSAVPPPLPPPGAGATPAVVVAPIIRSIIVKGGLDGGLGLTGPNAVAAQVQAAASQAAGAAGGRTGVCVWWSK
jgi:AMP deaminase